MVRAGSAATIGGITAGTIVTGGCIDRLIAPFEVQPPHRPRLAGWQAATWPLPTRPCVKMEPRERLGTPADIAAAAAFLVGLDGA
jgi:NAD(P)-dependent dehydrogenase (short-subunit alcohol dehydrogenase family)